MWTFDVFPRNNFALRFMHTSSKDFYILGRYGELPYTFYLGSPHFESSKNIKEVNSIAKYIIRLVNGCFYLVFENKDEFEELYLGDLYEDNQIIPGRLYKSSMHDMDIDKYLLEQFPIQGDIISQLIGLGLRPGLVRSLLLISGGGMTYINMYKILDEIKSFLKGKEKIEKFVRKNDLNRFTHTANNFEAIGLESRHGRLRHEKPKIPMDLKESQSFITSLVRLVIKKYMKISLPVIQDTSEHWSDVNLFD